MYLKLKSSSNVEKYLIIPEFWISSLAEKTCENALLERYRGNRPYKLIFMMCRVAERPMIQHERRKLNDNKNLQGVARLSNKPLVIV